MVRHWLFCWMLTFSNCLRSSRHFKPQNYPTGSDRRHVAQGPKSAKKRAPASCQADVQALGATIITIVAIVLCVRIFRGRKRWRVLSSNGLSRRLGSLTNLQGFSSGLGQCYSCPCSGMLVAQMHGAGQCGLATASLLLSSPPH